MARIKIIAYSTQGSWMGGNKKMKQLYSTKKLVNKLMLAFRFCRIITRAKLINHSSKDKKMLWQGLLKLRTTLQLKENKLVNL